MLVDGFFEIAAALRVLGELGVEVDEVGVLLLIVRLDDGAYLVSPVHHAVHHLLIGVVRVVADVVFARCIFADIDDGIGKVVGHDDGVARPCAERFDLRQGIHK